MLWDSQLAQLCSSDIPFAGIQNACLNPGFALVLGFCMHFVLSLDPTCGTIFKDINWGLAQPC